MKTNQSDESATLAILAETETKVSKYKQNRVGLSVKLRDLSRNNDLERVFGQELNENLALLSGYDTGKGTFTEKQKKSIRTITSIIYTVARKELNTKTRFVTDKVLEQALASGDPGPLVASVTQNLSNWKKSLPSDMLRAIERKQLELSVATGPNGAGRFGTAYQALDEAGSVAAAGAFVAGIGVIWGITTIFGQIAEWLSGNSLERHRHAMPYGVILDTETYLHVPWRGICIGNNNQPFTAQYKIAITGGVLDQLHVVFEMHFEGGGFDSLVYPIEGAAWDLEHGSHYPQPQPITTTRYHQKHLLELNDVGFLVIGVGAGKVNYGMDGIMTGAGLVPQVTATKSGYEYTLPAGESIWQYGLSF